MPAGGMQLADLTRFVFTSSSSVEAPILDLLPNQMAGAGTWRSSQSAGLIEPMNCRTSSAFQQCQAGVGIGHARSLAHT